MRVQHWGYRDDNNWLVLFINNYDRFCETITGDNIIPIVPPADACLTTGVIIQCNGAGKCYYDTSSKGWKCACGPTAEGTYWYNDFFIK